MFSVVEDATVTLFTVRPVLMPGPPPEYEAIDAAHVRVRNGDEVQERWVSLSSETLESIEGLADYLYSTGLAVTESRGVLEDVEGNVCDRLFEATALDLALVVEECEEYQLVCNLFMLIRDPDIPEFDWIEALVVLTGEEMKEIALQLAADFGFYDGFWGAEPFEN